MNWSSSYKSTPQNALVNKFLDTFCFTPEYKKSTLELVQKSKDSGKCFVLTSLEDGVCDIEGLESTHFNYIFEKGRHARLFHPSANSDQFKLVEDYLRSAASSNLNETSPDEC